MKSNTRKNIWLISLLSCVFLGGLFGSQRVSALVDANDSDFVDIALFQGLRLCYGNSSYVKNSDIIKQDFTDSGVNAIWASDSDNKKAVVVPTMIGNSVKTGTNNDSTISCREVMGGRSGSIAGLSERFGSSNEPQFYGYTPNEVASQAGNFDPNKIKISFSVSDESGANTHETTSNGELVCDGIATYKKSILGSPYYRWTISSCTGEVRLSYTGGTTRNMTIRGGSDGVLFIQNISYEPSELSYQLSYPAEHFRVANYMESPQGPYTESGQPTEAFKDAFMNSGFYEWLKEDIKIVFQNGIYSNAKVGIKVEQVSNSALASGSVSDAKFHFINDNANDASGVAVLNLANDSSLGYLDKTTSGGLEYAHAVWRPPYIYSLYYKYLMQLMATGSYAGHLDFGNCTTSIPSSGYYLKNSSTTWCEISMDGEVEGEVKSEKVAVVDGGFLRMGTISEVLEWLKTESNYQWFNDSDYANLDGDDPNSAVVAAEQANSDSTVTCMSAGGSKTLGWIACPVLEWLGDASEGLYNKGVKPALQVEPELFKDNNTRDGWSKFRDIANILFIIFFLVVIFSQLTGYGIDNYGIKKILPKMIIAAILINLSYFICQASIDIFNILGNALQGIFDAMGNGMTISAVGTGESTTTGESASVTVSGDAGGGGLVTVIILAALVGGAVAIFVNPALLLSLLITALGVVVSLFFLFVLLGVRKAAILVLTVISPLAVICLILPNTKNLFDKWRKFFFSLLMVYPIAGVLVGGGNYVSRLLLTTGAQDSFFMTFIAMIAGIVPIFFIPSVLKSSLNAIGGIGAKISGIGNTVKGGTVGRFAKSETRRRMATGMNDKIFAGARDEFANTRVGRMTGLRMTRARQIATAKKQRSENLEAGALLTSNINDRFEKKSGALTVSGIQKKINEAIASGNEAEFYALMDDAGKRFGASKQAEMLHEVIANTANYNDASGKSLMSEGKRTKFFRDAADRYGNLQSKDYATLKYLRQGGSDKSGAVDLSTFESVAENVNDFKMEEAATLNGGSLNRMWDNISSDMASDIMSNESLRKGMDQATQLMWAHRAQGGGKITKDQAEKELAARNANPKGYSSSIISQAAFDMLAPIPKKVEVAGGTIDKVIDVQTVQNVNGMVDVNIRDVNTKGAPQTQPLDVRHVKQSPTPPSVNGTVDVNIRNVPTPPSKPLGPNGKPSKP